MGTRMTDNDPTGSLDDDLQARVLKLSSRAKSILGSHPRTRGLVAGLPRVDTSPLRIALLGPYSAGKSMLIAALLRLPSADVDELTDAAPKTDEPTEYSWDGAILVDLPGTLSGNDAHANSARRGVRRADALMLVTTSELPGEAETRALRRALDADGFADRSVVVINKMHAENSDPEVILDEIRQRLGPFADRVPIVRTDAKDYVDAINDPDLTEDQREMLIAASGVDALDAALHRIVDVGVDGIRPNAQAFELVRVLEDAEQRWALDGEELAATNAANKVEAALSQTEERVLTALKIESERVASVIRTAGNRIAMSVSEKDGNPSEEFVRDADEQRAGAISNFEAALASSMQSAFDALTAAYGADVPEPDPWTFVLDSPTDVAGVAPDAESPLERNVLEAAKAVVKDGAGRLRDAVGKVAISSEKGGLADKVAVRLHNTRVGHKLLGGGKVGVEAGKFKPWGRGKAADKVAGAAGKLQWAALVIGPALDLKGLTDDHMKRAKIDKHREKISGEFDENARRTRKELSDAGTEWLSGWVASVEQSLSGLTDRGAEIIAEREAALGEIEALRYEAEDVARAALPPGT